MADDDTRMAHAGRSPAAHSGAVNIPPYRASTILYPTLDALQTPDPDHRAVRYGRIGTPSSHAFEEAVAALEGADRAVSFGSGLQAITTVLLAFARAGDHILVTDSCYGPTREFCTGMLAGLGVTAAFFDPRIGAGIAALMRPNTRLVFLESPGSLTFEVQDLPAIAAAAHGHSVPVVMDNTWSGGVFHKPLALGADISIQAATKYIGGHADANLGVAACTAETWRPVKEAAIQLGATAGADDLFLGLRGLRTLPTRLRRHQETGLILADWLAKQPETVRILHPGRPDHPDHHLWKRDFTGASGLFAVEIVALPRPALAAFLDGLELFGMGFSYGGFESLILPMNPARHRTAIPWAAKGQLLRIHAGLEDPDDLIADLDRGFARLRKAIRP